MKREEIIRIMLEQLGSNSASWTIDEEMFEQWLPFLQAIAAAEREACAVLVMEMHSAGWDEFTIAAKIRARGNEKE